MQAISPELEDYAEAKAGQFWHCRAGELGPTLRGNPHHHKEVVSSYGHLAIDDRGILARAVDGSRWDPPNAEFRVNRGIAYRSQCPNSRDGGEIGPGPVRDQYPGDSRLGPCASLTYQMMWFLVITPN